LYELVYFLYSHLEYNHIALLSNAFERFLTTSFDMLYKAFVAMSLFAALTLSDFKYSGSIDIADATIGAAIAHCS